MRLKQIKIIHFGQLSNLTFDLPSHKINVFFGENEAGKSTTVAFIKQVMFGFYLRSSASPFFEDYKPLAHVSPMGGSLIFEDEQGSNFELERLWAKGDKTKRGILTVKKDGQVVPQNLFFDQIQNIDGSFYTDSFIFNQEMLGQIASLSQKELLERIYYLGAANSGQMLSLRDDFNKEASRLFKKTGRKPEVNQLLQEVAAQREKYAATQKEFDDYEQINQKTVQDKNQLKTIQAKLAKLKKKHDELNKLRAQLNNYAQLQKLEEQKKPLKFDQQNYQKAQALSAQRQNLQQNIIALKKQSAAFEQSQPDLSAADKLVQQKSEILAWQNETRSCRQKAKQLQAEKEQLLSAYPNLKTIISLTSAQIDDLQKEYQALPQEQNDQVTSNDNSKTLLIIGAVLVVLGIILAVPLGWAGIVILIAGLALSFYAYTQKKTWQKTKDVIKQKAEQVQKQRSAFKQKYGLDPDHLDLNNILNGLGQYRLKVQNEADNQAELTKISRKLSQLKDAIVKVIKTPVENNFVSVLTALDQLAEKINQIRRLQERQRNVINNLQEAQDRLTKLELQLKVVLAKDGAEDMAAYEKRYQESLAQAKLAMQITALKNNLGDNLSKLTSLQQNPQALTQSLHQITDQISVQNDLAQELQNKIAQEEVELKQLADSITVFASKQSLANTENQLMKASEEYLANLLAAKWLDRTLDIAFNERFPKMLKSAREYLKILTGGRYVDLTLAKKITVTRFDGKKREVKYLSRGTAEQLYFALKLAFIEQIKDKINLPILIDDSFVNFDDQRIGYIEALLTKISAHNQVLIFTAQQNLVAKLKIKPLDFRKEKQNA